MLLAEFETTVQAFIDMMYDIGFDTEGFEPGYLQEYLRGATGFENLQVQEQNGYLTIDCTVVCYNDSPRCSAFERVEHYNIPVSMDGLYRIICKCGDLPTVTAVLEDGTLELPVGGIRANGSEGV
jgi:hypothetical protein